MNMGLPSRSSSSSPGNEPEAINFGDWDDAPVASSPGSPAGPERSTSGNEFEVMNLEDGDDDYDSERRKMILKKEDRNDQDTNSDNEDITTTSRNDQESKSIPSFWIKVEDLDDFDYNDDCSPKKRSSENLIEGDGLERKKLKSVKNDEGIDSQTTVGFSGEHKNEKDVGDIEILKGILEYNAKNGVYPFDNSVALLDFVKNWLLESIDLSNLFHRVLTLKKKYAQSVVGNPEFPSFHDFQVFELSKKLWSDHKTGSVDNASGSNYQLKKNSRNRRG